MPVTQQNTPREHIPFYPRFLDCNAEGYDPNEVIKELFEEYSIEQLRQSLWTMFASALLDDSEYSECLNRASLLFFYLKMSDLITAAHLLTEGKKERT